MLQFILFNILVFWLWWLFSGGFEACTRCVVSTAAFPFSKTMYSMGRCTLLFICMSICYGTQSWRSSKCRDRASEWAVNSNQHFPPPPPLYRVGAVVKSSRKTLQHGKIQVHTRSIPSNDAYVGTTHIFWFSKQKQRRIQWRAHMQFSLNFSSGFFKACKWKAHKLDHLHKSFAIIFPFFSRAYLLTAYALHWR